MSMTRKPIRRKPLTRWRGRRLRPALLLLAVTATIPGQPRADVLKTIGNHLTAGAIEKLEPMLAATVTDVDRRLTRHEDRIGDLAGGVLHKTNVIAEQRLDQVDRILEARLLQVKVEASELGDELLGNVGTMVDARLDKVNQIAAQTTKQLGAEVQGALDKANQILNDRVADVGREVQGALTHADEMLAARIDQVDEVAGRRLGNVDVIASKQRIALERTAVRVAVLVGLVVFVVFVMRRLWGTYQELTRDEPRREGRWAQRARSMHPLADAGAEANADADQARERHDAGNGHAHRRWRARGAERTWMITRGLGAPLLGHLALAGVAAGALFVLYDRLPFGAQKEAAELQSSHEKALETSLAQFDFARVRFHASQLEFLMPERVDYYRAMAAKGELLRDIFARPTLWATDTGLGELSERLKGARRLLGTTPDPDLLVVDAMVLWQTGGSRREEHEAVSACARALRLQPRGFALSPLARAYVETFLEAPYVDEEAGLGRNAETLADLRDLLGSSAPDESNHPLATMLQLGRLMRTVNTAASDAYVAMAQRQADLTRALRAHRPAAELATLRVARNAKAARVLDAWKTFDGALAGVPGLASNPAVLAVFRLDDALYVRAKWYADNPKTDLLAPLLASAIAGSGAAAGPRPAGSPVRRGSPPIATDPAVRCAAGADARSLTAAARLALAPPRVVWARRYQPLMDGPFRALLELQEADRFAANEKAARDLECALAEAGDPRAANPTAALPAARLGLYVGGAAGGGARQPFARALAPARPSAAPTPADTRGDVLESALRARGVRLL